MSTLSDLTPTTPHRPRLFIAGVLACIALTSLAVSTTYSSNTAGSGEICETTHTADEFDKTSTYAPPITFFSDAGTTVRVLCDVEADKRNAQIIVGTGDQNFFIYKYAYERDTITKKWRKIELSGEKTLGVWIVGSAAAELAHVPKKGSGEVLVYTCEQTNGAWKCGCKDKACTSTSWQLQKYRIATTASRTTTTTQEERKKYPTTFTKDTYIAIHTVDTTAVQQGDTVTFTTAEPASDVVVHFGDSVATGNVVSEKTIQVVVPYIEPGVYDVWLTTGNKRSKNIRPFVIQTKTPSTVRIDSISPDVIKNGSTVTIQGSGFTKEGNVVYMGIYEFRDITSKDGVKFTFSIEPEPWTKERIGQELVDYLPSKALEQLLELDEVPTNGEEFEIPMQVINANGRSNTVFITFK